MCKRSYMTLKRLRQHQRQAHSTPQSPIPVNPVTPFEKEQQIQQDFVNNLNKEEADVVLRDRLLMNRPIPNTDNLINRFNMMKCPVDKCPTRCFDKHHFFVHWNSVHLSFSTEIRWLEGKSKCLFCPEEINLDEMKQHCRLVHRH